MNAIKHVAHAFKHTYNATLVRSIAYLIGLFYFVVANDLFWTGNADWNTPLMTVLFNAPTTISNHYTSQVNHDMNAGGW